MQLLWYVGTCDKRYIFNIEDISWACSWLFCITEWYSWIIKWELKKAHDPETKPCKKLKTFKELTFVHLQLYMSKELWELLPVSCWFHWCCCLLFAILLIIWLFKWFRYSKKVLTMLSSSISSTSKTLVRTNDHRHMILILKHSNNTSRISDFEKWRIK